MKCSIPQKKSTSNSNPENKMYCVHLDSNLLNIILINILRLNTNIEKIQSQQLLLRLNLINELSNKLSKYARKKGQVSISISSINQT